ncbi:MAG: hypothetical protein H2045_08530 [Rhizobiales bacterium]|nr:hypothetical protein [Hyphomicrobiales bacterium]
MKKFVASAFAAATILASGVAFAEGKLPSDEAFTKSVISSIGSNKTATVEVGSSFNGPASGSSELTSGLTSEDIK